MKASFRKLEWIRCIGRTVSLEGQSASIPLMEDTKDVQVEGEGSRGDYECSVLGFEFCVLSWELEMIR